MRAREAASGRLDEALPELEAAWLDAHLRDCGECRAWTGEAETLAARLRTAPLERPQPQVELPRRRRTAGFRLTAAAAAAAVLVGGGATSSFLLGHSFGAHGPGRLTASASESVQSILGDSAQQHVLALLAVGKLAPTGRAIAV